MKLGIMNTLHLYSGVETEESLRLCADYGFRYIDLMTIADFKIRYIEEKRLLSLEKLFNQLKISPSCLIANVGGNGASSHEDLRNSTAKSVIRVIELAAQLGFPMVLFFPGEKEKGISTKKRWDYMKLFIEQCLQTAEKNKIILTFESNPRIYRMINSIDEMVSLLNQIHSPFLKATVDIGHLNVIRESPDEINKLKNQIIHAHITDNDGTIDTNETLGTGSGPIEESLKELVNAKFTETAKNLNVDPVAVIELGSPEKLTLKSMNRVLERSIEYLKKSFSQYFQNIEEIKSFSGYAKSKSSY